MSYGVAFLHEGLSETETKIIEQLFTSGAIQVQQSRYCRSRLFSCPSPCVLYVLVTSSIVLSQYGFKTSTSSMFHTVEYLDRVIFATCLIFVSSANARKNKNSNTSVVFSQTVLLSSYKRLTKCSCSFTLC